VVDRRDGKPDLEFARQIKVAIDRFLLRDRRRFVAVPDLGVAAGTGNQAIAGGACEAGNFVMHSADKWIGTADDATAVIAAGGDGVQAEIAKPLYQPLNVALANTVQLHGLAGGDPDAALGVAARQSVDALPLRAAENPAGYAKAHHELKQRFEVAASALLANVAIILLIDAVEFHQQRIVARYSAGDRFGQAVEDIAAKVPAARLQNFVGVKRVDGLGNVAAAVNAGINAHGCA